MKIHYMSNSALSKKFIDGNDPYFHFVISKSGSLLIDIKQLFDYVYAYKHEKDSENYVSYFLHVNEVTDVDLAYLRCKYDVTSVEKDKADDDISNNSIYLCLR